MEFWIVKCFKFHLFSWRIILNISMKCCSDAMLGVCLLSIVMSLPNNNYTERMGHWVVGGARCKNSEGVRWRYGPLCIKQNPFRNADRGCLWWSVRRTPIR